MLLAYLCMIWCVLVQTSIVAGQQIPARELDSLLQDYAFRAFVRPRTGVVYDANVPANFSGVKVSAMRLRSGSLRRRGVAEYKEFRIPVGVVEQPYVERLVLVYQNLGNLSALYYSLPGYTFLAPVLGLLAYNALNMSATRLPELDIRAAGEPIWVVFSGVERSTEARCVYFDLDGSVEFDNVVKGNVCSTTRQGHFSIVVESVAPAPAPAGAGVGGGGGAAAERGGKGNRKVWIIVGAVVGGAVLVALMGILVGCVSNWRRRKRIERMEAAAEFGVILPMAPVGNTKAPVAAQTRTRPFLENEFVP